MTSKYEPSTTPARTCRGSPSPTIVNVIVENWPIAARVLIRLLRSITSGTEKVEFSVGNNKALARAVLQTGRRQVVVVGMEAHVCVFQTARDLVRGGFAVQVPDDAVLSRTAKNHGIGLRLCERAGVTISCTEAMLFDLLGEAGTPEFKELSPLIR